MPLQRTEAIGTGSVAAASSVLQLTLTPLTPSATFQTTAVDVADLPRLFFWFRHTNSAAGGGISVTPQWAVVDVHGAGNTVQPDWLDIVPAVIIPFDVPVLLNYNLPAKFIRVQVTLPAGGGATETLKLVYGGTQ